MRNWDPSDTQYEIGYLYVIFVTDRHCFQKNDGTLIRAWLDDLLLGCIRSTDGGELGDNEVGGQWVSSPRLDRGLDVEWRLQLLCFNGWLGLGFTTYILTLDLYQNSVIHNLPEDSFFSSYLSLLVFLFFF